MPRRHLDLRMIVDLYYGEFPFNSKNEKIKRKIDAEDGSSFCLAYRRNDLPYEIHNRAHIVIVYKLGNLKKQSVIGNNSFWPFYTPKNNPLLIVPSMENPNLEKLKESTICAGGLFFGAELASYVTNEFIKMHYLIEKKYKV